MVDRLTEVQCALTACLFYHTDPRQPGKVFCKHADKPHYLKSSPCPLYRLDWQKQAGSSLDVLKLIRR